MSTGDRQLDAFASVFRRAWHDAPMLDAPPLSDVVVLIDSTDRADEALFTALAERLSVGAQEAPKLRRILIDDMRDLPGTLTALSEAPPDLVVCWRNLGEAHGDLPHSLGTVVDELSQTLPAPMLLLPTGDTRCVARPWAHVMLLSDALDTEQLGLSWAAALCEDHGTLYLAHQEDRRALDRVLDAIARVPDLDTDVARARLPDALLQNARRRVEDVAEQLAARGAEEVVIPVIGFATGVADIRRVVQAHTTDLLIIPARDDQQRAMRSNTHALAVELGDYPLLLL